MSIKGIRKNILLGIIMGSISFTLLACNKKEVKSVMDKNEVIVGLDDAFAPMGFKNESGEIVGFDVDLAKEVGQRLDKEVIFLHLFYMEWIYNYRRKKGKGELFRSLSK